MNTSRQLFELQKIDLQLDQWKARQEEITNILADDSKIKTSESNIEKLESKLTQAEKDLKVAEYEVNTQIDTLKKNQDRLYGGKITGTKELEDLQNEAAAFKTRLSGFEDTQLNCMMNFEDAEQKHKQAIEDHKRLIENTALEKEELEREFSNLEKENENLSPIRDQAANSFEENDINLYEKIRIKRKGLVITNLVDGHCSACGAVPTSSQAQLARSPKSITQCETCSRIFYIT